MAWFLIIVAVIVARKLYKRHERKHAERKRGKCRRRNSQPDIYTSHGCGRGSRRCGYGRGHWNQPVAVASSSRANASAPTDERRPITYSRAEQKQIIKAAKGLSREEIEQHIETLKRLFPDCEPDFIRQLLIREDHDHVERAANRLAETAYPTIVQPQSTSQSTSRIQAYQDEEDIMDAPPSYEQAMLTPPPESPRRSSWSGPERRHHESGGERESRGLFKRIAKAVKSS